jgi:hypothetical protein
MKGVGASAFMWIKGMGPMLRLVMQSAFAFGKGIAMFFIAPLKLAGQAVLWLSRALLLTPIGLAITAIALAAFLIYKYWEPIKNFFKGVWQEIKDAFSGGLAGVFALILNWSPIGLFHRAMAGVLSWFGIELPGKFTEFGTMMIQGFINGIKNKASEAWEATKSIGTSIKDRFSNLLGIKSPSRVFAQIGAFTMQGLEQGLANTAAGPLAYIKHFAGALTAASTLLVTPAIAAMPQLPAVPALAVNQVKQIMPAVLKLPVAMPDARPDQSLHDRRLHDCRLQDPLRMGGYASQPGAAMPASSALPPINITINAAPGMDEKKLADLVAQKIEEIERNKSARMRSRLVDAE